MAGDILGGALVGGIAGGLVVSVYLLVMKLLGKPIGRSQTSKPQAAVRIREETVPAPSTLKTEIKRFLMGVVWFFVLWVGARIILGAIVGAVAGAHAAGTPSYSTGYNAGQAASLLFFQQYGLLVLLGAMAAAVAGTLTEFLPGTRWPRVPIQTDASSDTPAQAGQWPPPPNMP